MMVLSGDLAHAPECIWSDGAQMFYVDEDGGQWCDEEATVPYVDPPCTCGYFRHLRSGQAKLRAALSIADE